MKKKQEGFTLLEVILVTALLGIIATVAVVSYTKVSVDYKLERYAQETAADLRWLQRQAVNKGGEVWLLKLAADGGQYQLVSRSAGKDTVLRTLSLKDEALKITAESIDSAKTQAVSEIPFDRGFNKFGYRLRLAANDGRSRYVHLAAVTARTRVSESAARLTDDGG